MRRIPLLTVRRLAAALLLFTVVTSFLGPDVARRIRRAPQALLAPFGDAGMLVTSTIQTHVGPGRGYTEEDIARLEQENQALRGRVVDLQGQVHVLRERVPEMRRIFGRLDRSQMNYELIPARVVARDAAPYGDTAVLNAGSRDGAVRGARVTTRGLLTDASKKLPSEGYAVLTSSALVGRLSDSWAFGATLQLVTDRAFRMQGAIHRDAVKTPRQIRIIEKGRAREVELTPDNNRPIPVTAVGNGKSVTAGPVAAFHNIRPGDILATVEDPLLPARVVVGRVAEAQPDPKNPGFVELTIEPVADLDALRNVYVFVPLATRPDR